MSPYNAICGMNFAAPTKRDKEAFEQLSPEEKRELLATEIERGLEGTPSKVSAEETMAAVRTQLTEGKETGK
jgi:hypothetical protein